MKKIALVTCGSREIGFGIAQALAAEQWEVLINGVRCVDEVEQPLSVLRRLGLDIGEKLASEIPR
jgi:3-oxoacyl-[acyl-carrier protein] reductase